MKSKEKITRLIKEVVNELGVEFFLLESVDMQGTLVNIMWIKEIDERIPIKRQDSFDLPFQLQIEPCSDTDHWICIGIYKDDDMFHITADGDGLLEQLGVVAEDIDVESLIQVVIKIAYGS